MSLYQSLPLRTQNVLQLSAASHAVNQSQQIQYNYN